MIKPAPTPSTHRLDYSKPGICEQTLEGLDYYASVLSRCADGRLASGSSQESTIKLWDLKSGSCQQTLKKHKLWVTALTQCADGRLASGSYDMTIRLWDVKSGKCQQTLKESRTTAVLTVCGDGHLASATDAIIKLWDVKSGKCQQGLMGHSDIIVALTQCADGRLASGSRDKTIKLWDVKGGKCRQTLTGHSDAVYPLVQCVDGRLASGSGDGTIKLWDFRSGPCQQTLTGHSKAVVALTLCADGRLASGSYDNTIKLWDVKSGTCLQTLEGHSGSVTALTVCADGRLASGSADKTIKLWNFPQLASARMSAAVQPTASHSIVTYATPSSVPPPKPIITTAPTPHLPQQQPSLVDLRQQAETYCEEGKYEEALKLFRRLMVKGDASAQQMVVNIEKIISESYSLSIAKPALPNAQPAALSPSPQGAPALPVHVLPQTQPTVIKFSAENAITIEVPYQDLTIDKVKPLGKGGFGVVYKGKWQMIHVAIKELLATTLSADVLTNFRKEAYLMAQLRHPNIVTFYKISTDKTYCIVMEWCEKGSLYDWIKTPQANDLSLRLKIGQEVAVGLSYLHQHNIIHCDLKSPNVLLDSHFTAKINDFGLSTVKTETVSTTGGMKGTLRWNPPELISGNQKHHSAETDIYSYGVILWELLSRKVPYHEQRNDAIVGVWITQGRKEEISKNAPASMAALITKCWTERTDQRPTAKEAAEAMEQVCTENANHNRSVLNSQHAKQSATPSDYRLASAVPTAVSTNQYRLNT